jgi:hypothetical protein
MTILYPAPRPVNASRPFGLGLACDLPAPPAWVTAVTEALIALHYDTASGRAEAVAWLEARGTLRGCPQVEQDDVEAVDAVFGLFFPDSPAADATAARLEADAEMCLHGDVEGPAESWPAWTDAHRYEPTFEDRVWWALESDRRDRQRRGLPCGLVPRDVAGAVMATSLVGHDA